MTRFILAILLAFSLASAPGPALSAVSLNCPMQGAGAAMAHDHEEMGCCTPACAPQCAVVCPAAVLSFDGALPDAPELPLTAFIGRPSDLLPSVSPAANDPPPRTIIS